MCRDNAQGLAGQLTRCVGRPMEHLQAPKDLGTIHRRVRQQDGPVGCETGLFGSRQDLPVRQGVLRLIMYVPSPLSPFICARRGQLHKLHHVLSCFVREGLCDSVCTRNLGHKSKKMARPNKKGRDDLPRSLSQRESRLTCHASRSTSKEAISINISTARV
jgi:hypothetical protein